MMCMKRKTILLKRIGSHQLCKPVPLSINNTNMSTGDSPQKQCPLTVLASFLKGFFFSGCLPNLQFQFSRKTFSRCLNQKTCRLLNAMLPFLRVGSAIFPFLARRVIAAASLPVPSPFLPCLVEERVAIERQKFCFAPKCSRLVCCCLLFSRSTATTNDELGWDPAGLDIWAAGIVLLSIMTRRPVFFLAGCTRLRGDNVAQNFLFFRR